MKIRKKLQLQQVEMETNGKTMARARPRRNKGLADLLLACPVKGFMRERRHR